MKLFKSRLTNKLRANTGLNIVWAFDYAKYIGRPLNLFITIIFKDRHDLIKNNHIFRKILNKTTRWNKTYREENGLSKLKPVWVYVFENPQYNPHVHWCLNIEKEQIEELKLKLEQWLLKLQGSVDKNSICVKLIDPYRDKPLANYLIKGLDEDFIDFLHVRKIAKYQGPIWGQRARVAREVGPTTIKRTGFKADKDRNKWEELHPWIGDGFVKPFDWNLKKVLPKKFGISFKKFTKFVQKLNRKWRPRKLLGLFAWRKKKQNGQGLLPVT